MKKSGWKQLVLSAAGAYLCKVGVLGCFPLIPAFFAAVYLEERGRWLLSIGMLTGMVAFLPITAIAKYGMALLFVAAVIRLSEWVDKRCSTLLAALAASLGTIALSVFGGVFDWKDRVSIPLSILEGIFIFGFVILAGRGVQLFLEEKEIATGPKPKEGWQEQKLLGYAQSFEGLSKTFFGMSKKIEFHQEEMGKIQQELTGRICSGCDTCAICWEPDNPTMYSIFSQLISGLVHQGRADEATENELKKHCLYPDHVVNEAVIAFEKASLNLAWYNRLLENREVIAQQLDAMAFIMQDCANESRLLDGEEKGKLSEVKYRAKEYGITTEEIHLYEKCDKHLQLVLKVRAKWGNCIAVKNLTKAVTGALDIHMHPHKDTRTFIGKETVEIIFEEEPAFHTIYGVSKFTKDGAPVSGDNFSLMEKDDGEFIMSISDGMGFGTKACKESEMVIELLEKFIEAGFSKETALRMLNSAMVIRGEDEQYSTVDITSVNLYTGEANFYKIGASATFIRHKNGTVECLLSTSLPVGVNFELEIEKAGKLLCDGDFLVMVTDGVLEYLQVEKPEETMEDIISAISSNHPGLLAKKILEKVMEYTGGAVKDDMTILAAAIWEK